jgi:hypothetical protein
MPTSKADDEAQAISELLLAALGAADLRAQLDANEIKTVGIALRAGMITANCAVEWLHEIGLVDQVVPEERS